MPEQYLDAIPHDYICGGCGAHHCKLWHRYSTGNWLLCIRCAITNAREDISLHVDGTKLKEYNMFEPYKIQWQNPAIPIVEKLSVPYKPFKDERLYYSYRDAPRQGRVWGMKLPTFSESK
jgi:hypothetical protein